MCHKYERKQELNIIDFPLRSTKNNEQKNLLHCMCLQITFSGYKSVTDNCLVDILHFR